MDVDDLLVSCPMPPALSELERQREALLQQISELGDFRPGSLTGTGGRCGNPGCHCHRPKDLKAVTESFANPAG